MRRPVLLLAVSATCALTGVPATAGAAAGPALRVAPKTVAFGHTVHISGRHWPVIEFCRPRVHLSLRSAQNVVPIATVRIRSSGRWRTTWVPRRARVGAGTWRLVARQSCESGEDGSPNPVRRRVTITIHR
jgi:hypothetical protein